jgi:hypothetical protein
LIEVLAPNLLAPVRARLREIHGAGDDGAHAGAEALRQAA